MLGLISDQCIIILKQKVMAIGRGFGCDGCLTPRGWSPVVLARTTPGVGQEMRAL